MLFVPIFSSLSPFFQHTIRKVLLMTAWTLENASVSYKVSGGQRRDTISQKVLEKEKGGMQKTVLYCFFPCIENKCSDNNSDINNMMPRTPLAGNESRCVQSKLFPAELQSQRTQSTQLLQRGLNQNS